MAQKSIVRNSEQKLSEITNYFSEDNMKIVLDKNPEKKQQIEETFKKMQDLMSFFKGAVEQEPSETATLMTQKFIEEYGGNDQFSFLNQELDSNNQNIQNEINVEPVDIKKKN